MKKILVLCGPAGVGKSTWANKYISTHSDTAIVSRDKIRFSLLSPDDYYFKYEKQVFELMINEIKEKLETYETVIIDGTHLNAGSRTKLLNALSQVIDLKEIEKDAIMFTVPIETAIEHNDHRTGRAYVPATVIESMYNSFTYPSAREKFDNVYNYSVLF